MSCSGGWAFLMWGGGSCGVCALAGEVVAESSAIISRLQAELDATQAGSSSGKGGW